MLSCLRQNEDKTVDVGNSSSFSRQGTFYPVAYAIVVTGPENTPLEDSFYLGEHIMHRFVNELVRLTKKYTARVRDHPLPLIVSEADRINFEESFVCGYCKNEFTSNNYKVYHHRHINSRMFSQELTPFLEIICNRCNLALKQKAVVALGHELCQFDFHYILQALDAESIDKSKILYRDSENIIALEIYNLRIIDTSNFFINCTLDDLLLRQRCKVS
jgi:hypothetical protein